jgi:hypothetical protein
VKPNPEQPGAGHPRPEQDYIVIDRQALRQMLDAVLKTLRATANMEELRQDSESDPGQYALLQANLRMARGRLIDGIENMAVNIERLPNVKLRDS